MKIPCANHMVKNLKKHLEESRKDYKDLTKEQVAKISYSARMIINSNTSPEECREGLLNCSHPKVESAFVWVDATFNHIQVCRP